MYLRLKDEQDWQSIPEKLLEDLAQLTKANSIDGNKKDNITVIYTPWSNVKKTGGLDVGQVTFHNQKMVYYKMVIKIEDQKDICQDKEKWDCQSSE